MTIEKTPEWETILEHLESLKKDLDHNMRMAPDHAIKEYFHGFYDAIVQVANLPNVLFKPKEEETNGEDRDEIDHPFTWANPDI